MKQKKASATSGAGRDRDAPYKPIGQYGLIGDMNSAALVGTDGSIDWCCFPRFDSPSVFAAILDDQKGGRFRIAPTTPDASVHQAYLPGTNILSTRFETPTGELTLVDFMPLGRIYFSGPCPHEIHRIVRCTRGTVDVRCTFEPRMDYARAETDLIPTKGGVIARGGRQVLSLLSHVRLNVSDGVASAEFQLNEGDEAVFVLAYGHGRPRWVESYQTERKYSQTKSAWEALAASVPYEGMWRDEVVRSLLVLHLMMYEPTGAIIAAPTSSLPEEIGGSRNWDYRYAWLRDSSFTMGALYRMGDIDEATRYFRWLLYQCKVTDRRTRIVYGISPTSSLKEVVLDNLQGYKGSYPVRVGNEAARHLQLDVFGEVIVGIDTLHRNGGEITDEAWSLVSNFADVVCNNWRRKDRSVWEIRGTQRHFVYSKVMCWAALDRAVKLSKALGRDGDCEHWSSVADTIKSEVLDRGWSDTKRAFVQQYDSDALDAGNLMIPFTGFLPASDPRNISTVEAIVRELSDGPLVRRYLPDETDDGLGGEGEGAFTILSFWLIGNLIFSGQLEKAKDYFDQVLGYANHLGLFAEMIHPPTKELLGNFPQAYSHVGLIHTALNLNRALSGSVKRNNGGGGSRV